jgi:excinuclease ABC subunit B
VSRAIEESLSLRPGGEKAASVINEAGGNFDITETVRQLEQEMLEAANNLEFEKAALLRDQVRELKRTLTGEAAPVASRTSYQSARRRKGRRY